MKKVFLLMLVVSLALSCGNIAVMAKSDIDTPKTMKYLPCESFGMTITQENENNGIRREDPPELFLFDMSVKDINGLLTTDVSGKSFKPMNLTYKYLKVSGELTNTAGQSTRVGSCYYNSNYGEYVAEGYASMPNGVGYTVFISNNYSEQYKSYAHYGFVNPVSGGYATGSLRFYDSAGPI